MTSNQLTYMANLERARDNLFNNWELNRSNVTKERENTRTNISNEGIRNRSNTIQNKSVDNSYILGTQSNATTLLDVQNRNENQDRANLIQEYSIEEIMRNNKFNRGAQSALLPTQMFGNVMGGVSKGLIGADSLSKTAKPAVVPQSGKYSDW